ncbi:DUF1330 domain-containing protein [Paraburkholderia bengalensis]|uniref:DUF1330 domain-containing protein n=1 Tax=Paraburkholderia bengalensis TaxID=2747562 RepID=A0ABU8IR13_9BURK
MTRAYVVVDVEITDPEVYEQYRDIAYPVIEKFGGKYLVRGGVAEVREGDWTFSRLIIVEFGTMALAREWYESPEYQPAIDVIKRSTKRKLVIVEGVAD